MKVRDSGEYLKAVYRERIENLMNDVEKSFLRTTLYSLGLGATTMNTKLSDMPQRRSS